MCFTSRRSRSTIDSNSSTSSPGSTYTASRVRSHPRTKPFFMKGGTAASCSSIKGRIPKMIVVGVDDLMFSSRISSAATAAGVEIRFARSPQAIAGAVRDTSARLVILDLNSQRIAPLDAVAALKADPALAQTPIVGFVSHVQADLIAHAREAGVDRVLARSAFVVEL